MKKILGYTFAAAFLFLAACKKDNYIKGGSTHNPKVDMTTMDYLKKNPLFDTLCLLIDKAGVADRINASGISFFAPTDYHIALYIFNKNARVQGADANKRYTVDSLIKYDLNGFRDSIGIYIIKKVLPYSALSAAGTKYETGLTGNFATVSYEEVQKEELGYNPATGVYPKLVYYQFGATKTYCQTSGIVTNTGMLFVIQNPAGFDAGNPTLYFRP